MKAKLHIKTLRDRTIGQDFFKPALTIGSATFQFSKPFTTEAEARHELKLLKQALKQCGCSMEI